MSQSQQHGVFYVGTLVAVRVSERNGFKNGDLVLIRDGSTETDKIAFKPGAEIEASARALPLGEPVVVRVIPARRAMSKAGAVYVRAPYALQIEAI